LTAFSVYAELDAPLDTPPGTPDDPLVHHLIRHVAVGVVALKTVGTAYREMLVARDDDTEPPRDGVLELAGDLAAVIQSAWRQPEIFQPVEGAQIRPLELFSALEHLLYSLVLLTDPDDRVADLPLTVDEIDDLLAMPELRQILDDLDEPDDT
jgi:hypothetical protein